MSQVAIAPAQKQSACLQRIEGTMFIAAGVTTIALLVIAALGLAGKFPYPDVFPHTVIALSGGAFTFMLASSAAAGTLKNRENQVALIAVAMLVATAATLGGLGIGKILTIPQISKGLLVVVCAGIVPAALISCMGKHIQDRNNPEYWRTY